MAESSIDTSAVTIRILFIILPFVMATCHCIWKRNALGFSKSECFLAYFLVIAVGLQGILVGHLEIFYSSLVADYIGQPNSHFLVQVGKAHTAFGVIGVLCFWFQGGWRSATAVGYSLFLLMLSLEHVRNWLFNPSILKTLKIALMSDFIVAVCLIVLLILRQARQRVS